MQGMYEKFLQNLRFADDLILVGRSLPQVQKMLGDLAEEAAKVGLELHMGKTKIVSNARNRRGVSAAKQVKVGEQDVEVLPIDASVMYLGKKLCMGEEHHDVEVDHRIGRGWAKFMQYKQELCGAHYSLAHRLRLFDATVTPTVLYGSGCWAMTLNRERKLQTAQRKMLRKILGLGRKKVDVRNTEDSSSSSESSSTGSETGDGESCDSGAGPDLEETWIAWLERTARAIDVQIQKGAVADWVVLQRARKWRWAGHVLRRKDGRWTRTILHWIPHGGERRRGRPATRWEDALEAYAAENGGKWEVWAENNDVWKTWEKGFIERGALRSGRSRAPSMKE